MGWRFSAVRVRWSLEPGNILRGSVPPQSLHVQVVLEVDPRTQLKRITKKSPCTALGAQVGYLDAMVRGHLARGGAEAHVSVRSA